MSRREFFFITDGTDYLVVVYREEQAYHDSEEELIVYVSVKMCHQLSVEKPSTIRAILAEG